MVPSSALSMMPKSVAVGTSSLVMALNFVAVVPFVMRCGCSSSTGRKHLWNKGFDGLSISPRRTVWWPTCFVPFVNDRVAFGVEALLVESRRILRPQLQTNVVDGDGFDKLREHDVLACIALFACAPLHPHPCACCRSMTLHPRAR